MTDIVARAQGMLDHWASTYQVDRGVLLEHEVATVAELVAEVERLRSDLMLSLMGSELEKLGAERDELGQRLSKLEVEAERDRLKAEVKKLRAALTEECRDIAVGSIETANAIGAHREQVAEMVIRVGYPSVRDERDQLKAEVERLRESGDRLAAMLDECASVIESAESERDQLRATVGRVRAYLERRVRDTAWAETAPCVSPREIEIFHFEIREIRAALAGDDGKGEAS